MAITQFKIDLLEEQNSKLVAEITELKREKTEFLVKEAGFIARIMELEQNTEKAKLRDTELNTRIIELERSSEKRFAKLKQNQNNTTVKLENDDNSSEKDINVPNSVIDKYIDHARSADTNSRSLGGDPASDITDDTSNSDVCQEMNTQPKALIILAEIVQPRCTTSPIRTETKSSEDKEIDEFLNSKYKERVKKQDSLGELEKLISPPLSCNMKTVNTVYNQEKTSPKESIQNISEKSIRDLVEA
ncbi:1587_t:CDS:2, partial [Diversispora eburnea]